MDINTLFKQFMQDPEFAAAFNEPLEEELIQSSSTKVQLIESIRDMKKYYPNISEDNFTKYIELDPTYKQGSDKAGQYAKWILGLANKNSGKLDGENHITDIITRFDKEKKHLKDKDIMKFKSIEDLENYLNDDNNYNDLSHRQEVRLRLRDRHNVDLSTEAKLIYEDEYWLVYIPLTYAASCKLGQGAAWCTASTESSAYYDMYAEYGDLVIIISKIDPNEKYLLSFGSDSFMDSKNNKLILSDFFTRKNTFNLLKFFSTINKDILLIYKDINKNFDVMIYPEDFVDNPSDFSGRVKKIIFADNVTVIDEYSFMDCIKIKSISLPNSVTKILENAFWGCTNLEYVLLPESLEYIGWACFADCPKLSELHFDGTSEQWLQIKKDPLWLEDATIKTVITKNNKLVLTERLIQSSSDKALQQNIKTEIKAGKKPSLAAAIAYDILRKNESMENKENPLNREEVKEFNNIFKKFLKEVSKNLKKAGFSNEFISNMNTTTTTKNAWIGWRGDKDPGGIIWKFNFKLSDYALNYKDIEGKIYPVIKESIENIKNNLAFNFFIKTWGISSGTSNVDNVVLSFDVYNYKEEYHAKTNTIDDEENLNIPTKQEILDWLSEDKENWEDFIDYFEKIYDPIANIDIDELLYWIEYYDLDGRFQTKFGISIYDIPYEESTLREDLEEVWNQEIIENMQDKKYIVFDHFNPETLYFVKNIPDDSWIWDSDYIIEDVTKYKGQCMVSNNDEYISVWEHPESLEEIDKKLYNIAKEYLDENPDEDEYWDDDYLLGGEVTREDIEEGIDNFHIYSNWIRWSEVDGDSSSQYQLMNLDDDQFDFYEDSLLVGDDEYEDEENHTTYTETSWYTSLKDLLKTDYEKYPEREDHYLLVLEDLDSNLKKEIINTLQDLGAKNIDFISNYIGHNVYFEMPLKVLKTRYNNIINGVNIFADEDDDLEEAMTNKEKLMKRFPDLNLEEAVNPRKALDVKKTSDAYAILYGWKYKNNPEVEIEPEEHSEQSLKFRIRDIISEQRLQNGVFTTIRPKESDFIFYVLYNNKPKLSEALHGKDEIDEFFKICNLLGIKTLGDIEKFADANKTRIEVNKLLAQYDSSLSTDAFFETLRDYKKEYFGDDLDDDFEYDDPLNVMIKRPKPRKDENLSLKENKLNKQEILDWISEHEIAWEDFVNYFEDIYQSSAEVPMDEIIGWISDHDELAEDFEARFNAGIFTDADDYDDDIGMFDKSEYGLEESLFDKKEFAVYDKNNRDKIISKHKTQEEASAKAKELGGLSKGFHAENIKAYADWTKQLANDKKSEKKVKGWGLRDIKSDRFVYTFDTEDEARAKFNKLADSQQLRFSVDPILESINNKEEKWNIGSNKLVSTDSQEYANLVDLAKLLQERSPNGYEYRVEKTYEDFGAGMQWYTIICDEKNGWGTHQVLDTKQWLDLANTGDIESVYQDVVSNKYFQDTIEKGKTTALFNHMNSLED